MLFENGVRGAMKVKPFALAALAMACNFAAHVAEAPALTIG